MHLLQRLHEGQVVLRRALEEQRNLLLQHVLEPRSDLQVVSNDQRPQCAANPIGQALLPEVEQQIVFIAGQLVYGPVNLVLLSELLDLLTLVLHHTARGLGPEYLLPLWIVLGLLLVEALLAAVDVAQVLWAEVLLFPVLGPVGEDVLAPDVRDLVVELLPVFGLVLEPKLDVLHLQHADLELLDPLGARLHVLRLEVQGALFSHEREAHRVELRRDVVALHHHSCIRAYEHVRDLIMFIKI